MSTNPALIEAAISSLIPLRRCDLPPLIERERAAWVHELLVIGGSRERGRVTGSPERAAEELRLVAKQADALRETLANLTRTAESVFFPRALQNLKTQLRIWKAIAETATVTPLVTEENLKQPTGPQKLALSAAYVFVMVTGQIPTRITKDNKSCGPFIDFLSRVFEARAIRASVENTARAALHIMEPEPVKDPS
jgi:hypothetical protein